MFVHYTVHAIQPDHYNNMLYSRTVAKLTTCRMTLTNKKINYYLELLLKQVINLCLNKIA